MLSGKQVILGVSGGIAAYKAVELLRLLTKAGAEVHVIMTAAAQQFVGRLTFQTLSGHPVHCELFDLIQEQEIGHISLADRADLVLIAPATANLIGKVNGGIADDLLSTTIMATKAPVLFAPAMNVNMWHNPIYQRNQRQLAELGYHFLDPVSGALACGWEGEGKLPAPERIFAEACRLLAPKPLVGKTVLVTAGPTREEIDPVRYLSNYSSGRMGYAIARAAWEFGARVLLVSGPTCLEPPPGVELFQVVSAVQMHQRVIALAAEADLVIKAAAVADYRPVLRADNKVKKEGGGLPGIELQENPDILADLGRQKNSALLVGFAAETADLEKHAEEKLARKGCDLLVANDVSQPGSGFDVETNQVRIFFAGGGSEQWPQLSKEEVARRLLTLCAEKL